MFCSLGATNAIMPAGACTCEANIQVGDTGIKALDDGIQSGLNSHCMLCDNSEREGHPYQSMGVHDCNNGGDLFDDGFEYEMRPDIDPKATVCEMSGDPWSRSINCQKTCCRRKQT